MDHAAGASDLYHGLFEQLQADTKSFWQSPSSSSSTSSGVRRLNSMPSPHAFYKEYVATSTPVIISGGASEWKAMRSWGDLARLARDNAELGEVTVDFTPDGKGDCVIDSNPRSGVDHSCGSGGALPAYSESNSSIFVKPEERRMKFASFVDLLSETGTSPTPYPHQGAEDLSERARCRGSNGSGDGKAGVPYLSHQNDSLRQEFPGLMADVEPLLDLARDAFGNEPDAVNLWIGDERSVSAVHKDHYENMYCVIRGEKHFTLLPPSDVLFLYEQEYPQGRYRSKDERGTFEVEMEDGRVPWIPIDPANPDLDKYPLFRYASPVQCRVGAGDILYLPALWYHRVAQKGITVAVNYWHDMEFDHKYVYYRFLQSLARKYQQQLKDSASLGHPRRSS